MLSPKLVARAHAPADQALAAFAFEVAAARLGSRAAATLVKSDRVKSEKPAARTGPRLHRNLDPQAVTLDIADAVEGVGASVAAAEAERAG